MDSSNRPLRFANVVDAMNNLLRRYAAGERDFRGIHLFGLKLLRDANLSGANLSQANLNSVDLSGANLSGANLEGANLIGSELGNANLSGANLTRASLTYARLVRANLRDAILRETDLEGADLTGCIMPNGVEDPAFERAMNAVGNFKRPAWKPVVREGDSDLRSSKFAGKPWLNANENWPLCSNCGNPMRFFFQLNLQDIPERLSEKFGKGMLQLFYCTNEVEINHEHPTNLAMTMTNLVTGDVRYVEHRRCESGEAFSQGQLVRIIQVGEVPAEFEVPKTGENMSKLHEGEFSPKTIISWQEIDDYPSWEDTGSLGIDLSPEDAGFMQDIGMYPQGDKLAGYPGWVQYNECPDCPVCNRKMEQLIFQLESDDNIPFLWGDVGTAYILQCEEHKEQVAFLWQCG